MLGQTGQDRHSRDAYFLQVTLGEGQEDPEIHVLLLKHLQVLQAPNLLKECCQVLQPKQNKLSYTLSTKASPFLPNHKYLFLHAIVTPFWVAAATTTSHGSLPFSTVTQQDWPLSGLGSHASSNKCRAE